MKARILLADDDKVFCNLVSRVLKRNEYEVTSVNSVEEAQKNVAKLKLRHHDAGYVLSRPE